MRRLEHRPVASRPQHVLGVQRDIIGGNLRRDVNESRKLLLRHERLELLELTLQQEQFTAGIRDEEVSESAIAARDELLAKVRATTTVDWWESADPKKYFLSFPYQNDESPPSPYVYQ